MDGNEICVCGHSKAAHRSYGCAAWLPVPSKKLDRVWCLCKEFRAKKTLTPDRRSLVMKQSSD